MCKIDDSISSCAGYNQVCALASLFRLCLAIIKIPFMFAEKINIIIIIMIIISKYYKFSKYEKM